MSVCNSTNGNICADMYASMSIGAIVDVSKCSNLQHFFNMCDNNVDSASISIDINISVDIRASANVVTVASNARTNIVRDIRTISIDRIIGIYNGTCP